MQRIVPDKIRGGLFGFIRRITLIDLALLILALTVVGFSLFRFSRKSTQIYVDLTYEGEDWTQRPLPPSYVKTNAIEVGDVVYDSTGNQVAKVIALKKVYWGLNRQSIHLTLLMGALENHATHSYSYNGQTLLIGQRLNLNLGSTSFTGMVTNIYSNPSEKNRRFNTADAEIVVKYRNLEPWHAEALKDITVTDSAGQVVASVKKHSISPAEMITTTAQGEVRKQLSPIGKDLTIEFMLHDLSCTNDTCFFLGDQALKIGYPFFISSASVGIIPDDPFNQSSVPQLQKSSIMKVTIIPEVK